MAVGKGEAECQGVILKLHTWILIELNVRPVVVVFKNAHLKY